METNNTNKSRRAHEREPYDSTIQFVVLYMETTDFKRVKSAGKIVDRSETGIGLLTEFPLEAGHVLEWDDMHKEDKLHIAMVKWAEKQDALYRAGLMFI